MKSVQLVSQKKLWKVDNFSKNKKKVEKIKNSNIVDINSEKSKIISLRSF